MSMFMRYQPIGQLFSEMNRIREAMDQTFGNLESQSCGWSPLADTFPPVNVWEDEGHLYAEAELPGLRLEDIEIYVTGGDQLALKGVRHAVNREAGSWHRQERAFGKFSRVIQLPTLVDAEKVEARFELGVLTIKLPKSDAVLPKKIAVTSD